MDSFTDFTLRRCLLLVHVADNDTIVDEYNQLRGTEKGNGRDNIIVSA
jgi:hypothetical protein